MQDFRPTEQETVSMEGREIRPDYAAHVGLDVHRDSIAVAVAEAGRAPAAYCGEIANRRSAGWRRSWRGRMVAKWCCSVTRRGRAATRCTGS